MNSISSLQEDDGAVMDDDDTETPLREADGYPPVKDITVLPLYIRSYCEGNEIRWLERTSKEGQRSQSQKCVFIVRIFALQKLRALDRREAFVTVTDATIGTPMEDSITVATSATTGAVFYKLT